MKEPWKQGIIIQVGPPPHSHVIKEDGGVYRRNRYHIQLDKSEDWGPEWLRTVKDLYTSDFYDSTEVDEVLRDSNHLLQVPVDVTVSQNSVHETRKSLNIVTPLCYGCY